jgi:hypothetical protein
MRSERSQGARHVTTHGGSGGRFQTAQGVGDMTSARGRRAKICSGGSVAEGERTLDQASCELDDSRVDTQIVGRSL